MIYLKLLFSLLIPLLLGWTIVALVLTKETAAAAIERLAWSWGLGTVFLTSIMFVLLCLKIPLTFINIMIPVAIYLTMSLAVIVKKHYPLFDPEEEWGTLSLLEKLLLIAISGKVLYVGFEALIKPVVAWDAWTSWAFKSKIFFFNNVPLISYFRDYPIGIVDYPLHLPLLETWIFNCLGTWNDQLVKVIFPIYFLSLLLAVFYGLRRLTNRYQALLFTFILSALPLLTYHATIEYADLLLACYFACGIILLYLWMVKQKDGFLWLSALFLGCLPLLKKEGLLFLIIAPGILLYYFVISRSNISWEGGRRKFVLFVTICLLIPAPWFIFKKVMDIRALSGQTPYLPAADVLAQRLISIGQIFIKKMFVEGNWNILWFIFLLTTLIYFKRIINSTARFLFYIILISIGILIVIYLLTDSFAFLLDGTTLNRNMLTLVPIVVFFIALIIPLTERREMMTNSASTAAGPDARARRATGASAGRRRRPRVGRGGPAGPGGLRRAIPPGAGGAAWV